MFASLALKRLALRLSGLSRMPTLAQGSDEMESKIDWSKAPEGATGHGNIGISHFYVWFSEKWYEYVNSNHGGRYYFGDVYVYKMDDISCVTYRPTTPSWSGEGLPPVGVVCEVRNAPGGWGKAVITHQGKGLTVWLWHSENPDQVEYAEIPDRLEFRPIRTTEQIEADERCKAIDEMVKALGMDDPGTAEYIRCGLIYDAGFRKP